MLAAKPRWVGIAEERIPEHEITRRIWAGEKIHRSTKRSRCRSFGQLFRSGRVGCSAKGLSLFAPGCPFWLFLFRHLLAFRLL